jgi:Ca-activated chloride channel homolog
MSNHDDFDDKLNALKQATTPSPGEAARRRAMDAALAAFDAEQTQKATQGGAVMGRLRSMFANLKGNWTMDTRLTYGFGTAAIALLLLPIGYQLYTSTAISPPFSTPTLLGDTDARPVPSPSTIAEAKKPEVPASQMATKTETVTTNGMAAMAPKSVELGQIAVDDPAGGAALQRMAEPEPMAEMAPQDAEGEADLLVMPAPQDGMADMAVGMPAPSVVAAMPAAKMSATAPSGDAFTKFSESPLKIVANEPVSTFSIDVDTASYAYVRRALNDGWLPQPDAVRIEELINYFNYAYPAADSAAQPFKPTVSVYPTPWNGKTQIVQIGIKGYVPPVTEHKPSNLVFLIDTSGSMDEPDKLPLLKRAFGLLVDQLTGEDTISIVAYAGSAGVVLEPTKATEKGKILSALENLSAGGSTAGAEGIELAYRLAEEHKMTAGNNRVILATDGDFNVGIEDPEELKTYIKHKRDTGVFLSVLGFGQGNYGDDTMQALAQNGNGNASYIDSFKEARKVLVEDAGGTLLTIAKDVKIQVEFNPAVVSEYRLIGYETRALNREDFNNDKVDAGDIGAGTTVTALYEITPVGSGAELNDPLRYETSKPAVAAGTGELGFLKMRFKLPDSDTSQLIETPISTDLAVPSLNGASDDARFAAAVAAFGQKLKGSSYGDMSWDAIRSLAQGARGADETGSRAEFVQLVDMAKSVVGDTAGATDVPQEGCVTTETSVCNQ